MTDTGYYIRSRLVGTYMYGLREKDVFHIHKERAEGAVRSSAISETPYVHCFMRVVSQNDFLISANIVI
jgi:hypothetical protein